MHHVGQRTDINAISAAQCGGAMRAAGPAVAANQAVLAFDAAHHQVGHQHVQSRELHQVLTARLSQQGTGFALAVAHSAPARAGFDQRDGHQLAGDHGCAVFGGGCHVR
jgi:hypothetical protein